MPDFPLDVIDEARRLGANYADARVIRQRTESLRTRDGAVSHAGEEEDSGFGVRVLASGAWGFAAHVGLDQEEIPRVVRAALEAARAASRVNDRPVELAPVSPAVDTYHTPVQRDPFTVPRAEKQDLLLEVEQRLRAEESVHVTRTELFSIATNKRFVSSDGADIRQEITECGAELFALATGDGKPARRTFENYGQAGPKCPWPTRLLRHGTSEFCAG